jgi:hypothetical protein
VLVFAFIGFLNSCTGLCIASLIFSLIGSISNPGGNGRVASTGVVFLIICCVSSKDYEDIFSGDIVEKANSTVVDTKTLEAKDDTNPNQNIDDTQQIIKKTTPVEATLPLPIHDNF